MIGRCACVPCCTGLGRGWMDWCGERRGGYLPRAWVRTILTESLPPIPWHDTARYTASCAVLCVPCCAALRCF